MLTTSQAYKQMMTEPLMQSRIEIAIANGAQSLALTDRDIIRESVSANWRSSNNQALGLGATYASSFSFTAMENMETEIEGNYLTITPVLYYRTGTNTEQEIPLGVYYCDSPTVYTKTTAYDCYDGMILLDKQIDSIYSGTMFNMLTLMCSKCGVTLGNTSNEIAAMVNGTLTIYVDPKYIQTWRDALSQIAIVLGGYAQFGRDGKLYIRQFHNTPDMTLLKKRRISSSFAGYKTCFAGIQCRFLANENFFPYESIAPEAVSGIIMDVGDISIIQANVEAKQAILTQIRGILDALEYYPCEITMVGDPSIEAGDMLATPNREGYLRNILLTSVTFNWRKECEVVSEGANPKMLAVTTTGKKTNTAINNSIANSAVVTATYKNANIINFDDSDDTEITYLRFVTNKDLTAIFGAEIPVYSDGDGIIKITYAESGITGDVVRARVHEGYNLITLVNHLHYDANQIVLLTLSATTEAIGSGSAPEVQIAQDSIRSYIFAQGIEAEAAWDGIIVITEDVNAVEAIMRTQGITEACAAYITSEQTSAVSAVVAALETGMETQAISGTISVEFKVGEYILKCGHGQRCGAGRMFAPIARI